MITVKKVHLPSGHRVRPGKTISVTSLTIHSTGNANSTPSNERAWFDNPTNTRDASWHLCISDKECVEAIPLTEMAWHAGSGNNSSVSIEICESGDRAATLERAAELAAGVLRKFNLTPSNLKRHYDWTQKSCPSILMANNWAGWKSFVERVTYFYNLKATFTYEQVNKGKVTADSLNVRSTPELKDGNIVKAIKQNTIVDISGESGNFYKIPDGYVSKSYINAYYEAPKQETTTKPTTEKEGLTVILDGQKVVVDGMIIEGRTYIQMRELCEMLGFKVGYNGNPTIDTK